MILIAGLVFVSCSTSAHITVQNEFTVKTSENEKAWSRAHALIYKTGIYNYSQMDNYTITSKNYTDEMDLGIVRESAGADYKYTLIYTGFSYFSYISYPFDGDTTKPIYHKKVFESVAIAKKRWVEARKKEIGTETEKMKKYILEGGDI